MQFFGEELPVKKSNCRFESGCFTLNKSEHIAVLMAEISKFSQQSLRIL